MGTISEEKDTIKETRSFVNNKAGSFRFLHHCLLLLAVSILISLMVAVLSLMLSFCIRDGQCPEYSEEQAICAVGLAKSKPGVFVEAIQYLLVLSTPVEVVPQLSIMFCKVICFKCTFQVKNLVISVLILSFDNLFTFL